MLRKLKAIPPLSDYDKRRFWSKVDKNNDNGCWVWLGARFPKAYGRFTIKCKSYRAHRVSWFLERGVIPPEILVLHKCDNRPCVNPGHLFLGTFKINSMDMVNKGRSVGGTNHWTNTNPENIQRGENCHSSKKTETEILEIRKLSREGVTQKEMSRIFMISQPTISDIVRKVTWSHL